MLLGDFLAHFVYPFMEPIKYFPYPYLLRDLPTLLVTLPRSYQYCFSIVADFQREQNDANTMAVLEVDGFSVEFFQSQLFPKESGWSQTILKFLLTTFEDQFFLQQLDFFWSFIPLLERRNSFYI